MSKTSRVGEAIDRLAELIPNGHLLVSTDPAGFLDVVVEEIVALRKRATVADKPTTPDYPWHLAPEGTVGAATDADGKAYWWIGEMPWVDEEIWCTTRIGHQFDHIPDFSLPGDWRESWRWMPGKEPK